MFDRDGNLWVGTDAKGVVRIRGDAVEHYGQTDGLSGDSVWTLFEDREGIVWAGTTSGIDSFRDPRVVTFSAVEGLGKDLAAGILASQRRHDLGCKRRVARSHRQRDRLLHSQGDGLPGRSSRLHA